MELRELGPDGQSALEQTLGYLNFSEGAEDLQFLAAINRLFALLAPHVSGDEPLYRHLILAWTEKLGSLEGNSAAFQDVTQARQAIHLLGEHLLPGYLNFHRDLLFHQSERTLMRPLFVGRACEALLRVAAHWEEPARAVTEALRILNDFVGYRPVAVLENRELTPYPHEKVRPIPIYIRGVGVEAGPLELVVTQALEMLRQTDPRILRAAHFDPDNLRELAIDPRAYDFDHPVNKRPNYHFGLWDPLLIDPRGYYCRFVVQEVTLHALMSRLAMASPETPRRQLEREAAAVLAGTILMASGVSGGAPGAHDSNTTLGNLLPGIAAYRDRFYEQLIVWLGQHDPEHAGRLYDESRRLRQPFGAARQHLNAQLTRGRATQLERVRLANVFARMGRPEAAQRQVNEVPVASARMQCQMDCQLTQAQRFVQQGRLPEARTLLVETRDLLRRAIDCGAVVDPWNILGFDGNFSLFPAMENSIHDHRVDELVDLVEEMFDVYGQLWSMSVAMADQPGSAKIAHELEELTQWWHQFAAHEVTGVDCADSQSLLRATSNVAQALEQWHRGGEATGDIAFWAPHVEQFDSPKAYGMVLNLLLNRRDLVAARGLLIHWLGQSESVELEQGEDSFYNYAMRWLVDVLRLQNPEGGDGQASDGGSDTASPTDWQRVRKFFEYLEANAGEFWRVPHLDAYAGLGPAPAAPNYEATADPDGSGDDEEDSEGDLFDAAYEGVVFRDSTDDGIESSVFESGHEGDAWDVMHDSVLRRLAFLNCLSRTRRVVAMAWMLRGNVVQSIPAEDGPWQELLRSWLDHSLHVRQELEDLLLQVWKQRLAKPSHDYMSLAEFDRERVIKESLMEHIIVSCAEATQSAHFTICALREDVAVTGELSRDEQLAIRLLRAALMQRPDVAKNAWRELKQTLRSEPILYVPLVRGGNPRTIVTVRTRQLVIRTLLSWMPRLGLLTETRELVDVVRQMERSVPVGPGAVTEFDDLFEIGFRSLIESVIRATDVHEEKDLAPSPETHESTAPKGTPPVSCLERMTESMLVTWLSHSRTLRLSVLEKVKAAGPWQDLVDFVKRFGEDLFTQQFLSLANVRSILYQGVDAWFEQLQQNPPADFHPRLLEELESHVPRDAATQHLTLILEAIVENYTEYRDYNSTTTQSDRGDLLYNLLDFLRLLSNYERVVWNLKPIIIAHELLVRNDCQVAADMWRRALTERIAEEADRYEERLLKLQQRYAMRLPTIADRIGERFLRPLVIDRMRALVRYAMQPGHDREFAILEESSIQLTRNPSGVGFEPPAWLIGLEEEVRRVRRERIMVDEEALMENLLPALPMSIDQVEKQVETWIEKS